MAVRIASSKKRRNNLSWFKHTDVNIIKPYFVFLFLTSSCHIFNVIYLFAQFPTYIRIPYNKIKIFIFWLSHKNQKKCQYITHTVVILFPNICRYLLHVYLCKWYFIDMKRINLNFLYFFYSPLHNMCVCYSGVRKT